MEIEKKTSEVLATSTKPDNTLVGVHNPHPSLIANNRIKLRLEAGNKSNRLKALRIWY